MEPWLNIALLSGELQAMATGNMYRKLKFGCKWTRYIQRHSSQ